MKPRAAIICASNPGNAGMYSVDLAAVDFMTRNSIDFDLFTSHAPSRRGRYRLLPLGIDIGHQPRETFGNLIFKRFSKMSQLSRYSHVLYWGDFTPNPVYGQEDFHRVQRRYDVRSSGEQSLDRWARLFNFSGGKTVSKIIAVGNNFQHDYSVDSDLYQKYLQNLGSNFDLIMPRDLFSVANLKSVLTVPSDSKVRPGLDPAFLLRGASGDDDTRKEPIFCYRFARSKIPSSERFLSELEKATGCRGVHLSQWDKFAPSGADSLFSQYISDIRRSRFVVTDLYHLAINAMRLGVPVFGLGNPAESQRGSLGDFKKKILFKMLNLERFYIEVDPGGSQGVDGLIEQIGREFPLYEQNLSDIYSRKNRLVQTFEDDLLSALVH